MASYRTKFIKLQIGKLLFPLLLFCSLTTYGQSIYKPGYLITNTNDTIYGEIEFRSAIFMAKYCRFKTSDGVIADYIPSDIKAYRFIDSKYYVAKELENKKVFLEYLINGQLCVYYYSYDVGEDYYMEKEKGRLVKIPYSETVVEVNEGVALRKSNIHTGFLIAITSDTPSLAEKINTIERPSHETLISLAKSYHDLTCDSETCIIYEKTKPGTNNKYYKPL